MTDADKIETLYKAVKYTLDRSQTDPDFGYYCGPLTQTFALLCEAEAVMTGETAQAVGARRRVDLQPEYRKRKPEVQELQEKLKALEKLEEMRGRGEE